MNLLFDFAVDPLSHAVNVNEGAAAFALARRDERILFSDLATEANFAAFLWFLLILLGHLCSVKSSGGFFEMVGVSVV